ncbi:YggS family pyridoxal phosphate-dependent enzyme [Pseudoneobacillus sp. C159]
MDVVTNLKNLNQQISETCRQSNRNPNDIKIIAVTKYVSIDRANEALAAGVEHLGENRDDGLLSKWQVLKNKPIWHFIGTLQTRKVKNIIDVADYIHSLDRLSLAEEINKRAIQRKKCLVQVNVSGEDSKHGLSPSEVVSFIESLKDYPNILVVGLMTMAPNTSDDTMIRHCFRTLKSLQGQVMERGFEHAPCLELSMGMSNDFKIAIEEGATMIRIGTALVGE